MRPPLISFASHERQPMVVTSLGYTPNTPRTEVQNPVCSPARRGSHI